jgi:hypothetical protein
MEDSLTFGNLTLPNFRFLAANDVALPAVYEGNANGIFCLRPDVSRCGTRGSGGPLTLGNLEPSKKHDLSSLRHVQSGFCRQPHCWDTRRHGNEFVPDVGWG